MTIYVAMTLGTFAVILSMRRDGKLVENIADLAGLSRTHPTMAFFLAMLLFSLAGIPPLAGFFAKFYVFLAAIKAGLYVLAVIGVLTSVVGAYYYLAIVKLMYFDEPAPQLRADAGPAAAGARRRRPDQYLVLRLSGAAVERGDCGGEVACSESRSRRTEMNREATDLAGVRHISLRDARLDQCRGAGACARRRARAAVDHRQERRAPGAAGAAAPGSRRPAISTRRCC